ncbi:hypothetical protein Bca101_024117 [Brassica carinata]
MLQELGTPTQHISGAPFVLIPDENIEEAKEEFRDCLFARFQGEAPYMGRIIGIVNAIWSRDGRRIFVHRLGPLTFLLRVTNPRTQALVLARSVWIIAGFPMFVAPWSSEFSPEEPQLTSAVIPVELRGVPYLLFNNQSLSRLATAVGKPVSLAPETEIKENFEVAKLWVRVNLLAELPKKIVSGFSNGREVDISVSYPWLPVKCSGCGRFGHESLRCSYNISDRTKNPRYTRRSRSRESGAPRRSRTGRASSKNRKPLVVEKDNTILDSDKKHTQETPVNLESPLSPMTPMDELGGQTVPPQSPESHQQDMRQSSTSNTQVISLERACCASSVTVTHSEQIVKDSSAEQAELNSSPFFLVSNRKSGRKATRH